jgi:iron(III) transport system substrate-binding protein
VNAILASCCSIVAVLSLNLLACGEACAQKNEPSIADIANLQGQNRLQTLREGARKEGGLTVYAAMPADDLAALVDAFSRKYGIKVTTWRSGSEGLVQRMVAEARSGRYSVDIVQNNAPATSELHREHLLQPVSSPFHADLMPQAVPAHKEWVGLYVLIFLQVYNTDKVRKEELPAAYADLRHPRWKGRLGIEADDQPWFAYVLRELGQDQGTRLFKDIVRSNGISVRKGHTLLANLVASGEIPLSLTVYSNKPMQLKREGAPVDWFVIPPAIAQFTAIGLLKRAPHPHAAMLFYDFLLSDAQQILSDRDFVPTSNKINAPLKKLPLKFIDPELFLDMNDKWVRSFNDVFLNRTP